MEELPTFNVVYGFLSLSVPEGTPLVYTRQHAPLWDCPTMIDSTSKGAGDNQPALHKQESKGAMLVSRLPPGCFHCGRSCMFL
mmetsp:Transcript_29314/g.43229  ORF Transcript_29314/g.43229 Transcript_29314/m.43229 type:complete len:83 (-) Transcript_29314:478-726(-)